MQHNSLGFGDIEFERDPRPTMLFIGDSFVWGVDAEADERFTDLLRSRISNHRIVNADVSGYGTDQEYLLLGLGGRASEHVRVGVDESQILALLFSEALSAEAASA